MPVEVFGMFGRGLGLSWVLNCVSPLANIGFLKSKGHRYCQMYQPTNNGRQRRPHNHPMDARHDHLIDKVDE